MEEYEASYNQICNQEQSLVMIPGNWNITQTITLCKNVRGEINVIKDPKNNEKVRELGNKSIVCRRNGGNSFNVNYVLTDLFFVFISLGFALYKYLSMYISI